MPGFDNILLSEVIYSMKEVRMKVEIYWDSLFVMNVLINWGILELLKKKFSLSANIVRIVLTAFVGACIYLTVLIYFRKSALCQLSAVLCSMVLMGIILLGKRARRFLGKILVYGCMYSLIISGVLRVLLKHGQSIWGRDISVEWILTGVFVCVKAGLWYMEKEHKNKKRSLCSVTLESSGVRISVKALLDTGNRLVEPISKKPVCIVDEEILAKLTLENPLFFRAIPFRSVGCEKGMVYGVQIPKVHIEDEGKTYIVTDVICAGIGHKLSARNEYQMIIHPEVLMEE